MLGAGKRTSVACDRGEKNLSAADVFVFSLSGLNVHSMLKHESIILTLETVKFLEDKLLWHDQRYTPLYPFKLPYSDFP